MTLRVPTTKLEHLEMKKGRLLYERRKRLRKRYDN